MKHFIILVLLFFTKTIFALSFSNTATSLAESAPLCNTITTINNAKLASAEYIPLLVDCNTWVSIYDHSGDELSLVMIQSTFLYDTIIGILKYKKTLQSSIYTNTGPAGPIGWHAMIPNFSYQYYREDTASQRIYQLYHITTGLIEKLIFDFDLSIGDTINSITNSESLSGIVDSIGTTIMLDGQMRETFWLSNGLSLVEGLGYIPYVIKYYNENLLLFNTDIEELDTLPIFLDTISCKKQTTALSLDLLHFSATSTCDEVVVQWSMSHDENIDYFTLQRSLDAQNWETVAHIPALNNGNAVNNYSYKDAYKATVNTYYRIATTYKNAIQDYSSIQTVKNNCSDENTINITPNPSSGTFSIHSANQNITKISVLDVLGKEVYHQVASKKNVLQTIDISAFANGIYLLHITTENGLQSTHKLVKY